MTQKTRHTTQIMNDECQAFEWILAINSPWLIDRLTFLHSWRKWSDFLNITNCCWEKKNKIKIMHRGRKEEGVKCWLWIAHPDVSAAICSTESPPIDAPPFSHLGMRLQVWLEKSDCNYEMISFTTMQYFSSNVSCIYINHICVTWNKTWLRYKKLVYSYLFF